MKKSELYHLAQIAVINSSVIAPESKIETLLMLFEDEKVALYVEEREANETAVQM